jgi:phosphatidylglycerophosphate synthase
VTEGEAWARELLAELRAASFRPWAWVRFLRRSFVRAGERRRERSREHRSVLLLAAVGVAAWLLAGLAVLGWDAAAGAGWWLAVCVMLDWHLGLLERPDGRPLGRVGAANSLSLLRAGLAPALLLVPPVAAGALLLAAGASDAVDGPLARRRDEITRLGLWLDGAVDTFVLGAAALAAPLPAWVTALVLARCALPWLSISIAYFARARAPDGQRAVPGRYPGLVLFAGLALALFGLPGGAGLAAAGALAGLVTFAGTVARQHAADLRADRLAASEPAE